MNELVSIIIPCYNYAHILPQTLDSVLKQTYGQWECIIVDDGSKDNTKEVVHQYITNDSRFKYKYQENKGPNAARNIALLQCNGSFIQFLDADDLLESKKLEIHVNYLKEHSQVDIVYSEARYFTSQEPSLRLYSIYSKPGEDKPWMPKVSGKGEDILIPLLNKNIMVNSSPLLRKTIVDKVGLSDEELWQAEDWHFWIKCALAGAYFQYINHSKTLVLIRFHPFSNSTDRWKMFFSELIMRNKIQQLLVDPKLSKLNKEIRSRLISLLEKLANKTIIYQSKKIGRQRLLELYKTTRKTRLLLYLVYATLFPTKVFAKSITVHVKLFNR